MSSPKPRVDYEAFAKLAPGVQSGLRGMTKAVGDAGLDPGLIELVKIRASQINGCAFCLQYHLTLARKLDVAPEKLDLLAAWHDAPIYSGRERAALAWAETLTRVAEAGASDQAYAAVRGQFSETETVFLTVAIATINAWNRIGVGLVFTPPIAG